jgi:glucuronate isomerase
MRTLGIPEDYIAGKASDKKKFLKWAKTVDDKESIVPLDTFGAATLF